MPFPPAGVTAASFFTPVDVISTSQPAALLCDWIDPATNDLKSVFAAPSPIVAAFQHHFTVERRSGGAVRESGQRFKDIKKNDDSAARRIKDEIDRITQPFIQAGYVSLDGVTIANTRADLGTDDMAAVVVNFEDLVFDENGKLTL